MRRALILTALSLCSLLAVPTIASAQDAHKFTTYQATMKQKVAPLPIFQPNKRGANKGSIVDNEVIVTLDASKKQYQAVYVVQVPIQAVLDFYKEKLGFEAKQTGSEVLGDVLYTFKVPLKQVDTHVLQVQVRPLSDSGKKAQISLMKRAATALDERVFDYGQ
ncbi:MAG: hypothetical protein LBM75_02490 [Myxococcales bacterium]|jgi:hypothetical protein|nr:hypothetical protein [Myxococcales bacterium]